MDGQNHVDTVGLSDFHVELAGEIPVPAPPVTTPARSATRCAASRTCRWGRPRHHHRQQRGIFLTGGGGVDTLSGLGGSDTLVGGALFDTLDGGVLADVMKGGPGSDTYAVDDAGDDIDELLGEGVDLVNTTLNTYALEANVDNVSFFGTGSFNATGNAIANRITTRDGFDTLDGRAGVDTMLGGGGSDTYHVDGADVIIGLTAAGRRTSWSRA